MVTHQKTSNQNQKLPNQTKNAPDILSDWKNLGQKLHIQPDYASDQLQIEDVHPNFWEKKIDSS